MSRFIDLGRGVVRSGRNEGGKLDICAGEMCMSVWMGMWLQIFVEVDTSSCFGVNVPFEMSDFSFVFA